MIDIPNICKDNQLAFTNTSFPTTITTTVEVDATIDISSDLSSLTDIGEVSLLNLSEVLSATDFTWLDSIEIYASPHQQDTFVAIVFKQLSPEEQNSTELMPELLLDNEGMLAILASGPVDLRFIVVGRVPAEIGVQSRLCTDVHVDVKKYIK